MTTAPHRVVCAPARSVEPLGLKRARGQAAAMVVAGSLVLGACVPEPPPGTAASAPAGSSATAAGSRPPAASAIVCSATADATAPREPAGGVARVELRGSDDRSLCSLLSAHAGPSIDEATVAADVRALFASGAFRDVVAAREDDTGRRFVLAYELEPQPRLRELWIDGISSSVGSRTAAGLKSSKPRWLDESWLVHARAELERAYRDEGFRHVRLEQRVEPAPEGAVDVTLRVSEGPEMRVSTVRLEGLRVIDEQALRAQLATTPRAVLSDPALERDALVIAAAAYDRGLVEIRVEPAEVVEAADGSSAAVSFRVAEGPVYRLGSLRVAGEGALSLQSYGRPLARLHRGDTFSRMALVAARDAIRAEHERRGARLEVTPQTELDAKQHRVDVVFMLSPAGPARAPTP